MRGLPGEGARPAPPWERFHVRLLERAGALERVSPEAAAALRAEVEAWWSEQQEWNEGVAQLLSLHHEINNALVGVRGNAQLLLIGPAGTTPGVKERLEVVIRESERIQQAAARLRELRSAFPPGPASRAA